MRPGARRPDRGCMASHLRVSTHRTPSSAPAYASATFRMPVHASPSMSIHASSGSVSLFTVRVCVRRRNCLILLATPHEVNRRCGAAAARSPQHDAWRGTTRVAVPTVLHIASNREADGLTSLLRQAKGAIESPNLSSDVRSPVCHMPFVLVLQSRGNSVTSLVRRGEEMIYCRPYVIQLKATQSRGVMQQRCTPPKCNTPEPTVDPHQRPIVPRSMSTKQNLAAPATGCGAMSQPSSAPAGSL